MMQNLVKIQHLIIDGFIYVTFILFFLIFIGIIQKQPIYVDEIIFIFKVFISFYLMIRFNDFRKNIKFTELDRKVCFSAGTYLLLFSFADLINDYSTKIKTYLKPYLPWIK
jgi:hypothetical protein